MAISNATLSSSFFSHQSPTAIAFINTTLITEHAMSAVVYDMNRDSFTANLSIYGYDEWEKPSNYTPISPMTLF